MRIPIIIENTVGTHEVHTYFEVYMHLDSVPLIGRLRNAPLQADVFVVPGAFAYPSRGFSSVPVDAGTARLSTVIVIGSLPYNMKTEKTRGATG